MLLDHDTEVLAVPFRQQLTPLSDGLGRLRLQACYGALADTGEADLGS